MIDLKYSLVIEATSDPEFFGFYSPDLEGFTGVGHSVEDCIYLSLDKDIVGNIMLDETEAGVPRQMG
jgi:hypothetical protein